MSHLPRECPAWGKKCYKCGNKIILVLNAGPSNQEEEIENPAAHPQDERAKVSQIGPGLEATW